VYEDANYYANENDLTTGDRVAKSAAKTAFEMKADHICVMTETGRMAT
jgi:pyruvate kinase